MPDFPELQRADSLPILNTFGVESMLGQFRSMTTAVLAGAAWTTANTAIYIPVTITSPFLAQQMAVNVTTQSGNCDVGVYDERGNRLVSAGSTAVAAAGLQAFNITDTWLMPGTYFIAMNVDNTTAAFMAYGAPGVQTMRACGLLQQAVGAVTLPNPATFAAPSLSRALPLVVVTGATV